MAPAELAVIGGGAAGLFVIREAIRRRPELSVRWFAAEPHPGIAWATDCPVHLLNVPVERMGAREPGDFLRWLGGEPEAATLAEGQFLPRMRYGAYLQALAAALPDTVWRIEAGVTGLERAAIGWRVNTSAGELGAQRVVVAVGMPRSKPAPPLREAWDWWLSGETLDATAEVLLAGSGLTAVDLALGLRQRGHRGPITVVSPGGRWPEVHAAAPALPEAEAAALIAALRSAGSARAVVARLRAAARNRPWRAVIDARRPQTNTLWQGWPLPLRARLLRHGFGPWNRHRHRMAPEVAVRLAADPDLSVVPGRIRIDHGRLWRLHRGTATELAPALALDCRGPPLAALLDQQPWLSALLETGELKPHPLGSGLATPVRPDLALIGAANFGALFETTAVPELRAQAQALATRWFGAPAR